MSFRPWTLALAGAMILGWTLPGMGAEPGPNKTISAIQTEGNRTMAGEDIISGLKVKPGDRLQEVQMLLDQDLKALWRTGKFKDVSFFLVPLSDDTLRLLIKVQEKPLITSLKVRGQVNLNENELIEKSELKPGMPYDTVVADEAARKLTDYYKEKDFFEAEVKPVAEMAKDGQFNLVFEVKEGVKVQVTKISVSGNQAFSESKLKDMMDTKESGWFGGGSFKAETFFQDLKKVLVGYAKEGYVKAQLFGYSLEELDLHRDAILGQAIVLGKNSQAMTLTLMITEGPQFKLGQLFLKGNVIYSEEDLLGRIELKPGMILDRVQFERDLQQLRLAYSEKGYIYSDLTPEFKYNDEAGIADLVLFIREGTIARVSRIDIRGNTVTKDKVIRRELTVEPGEPFDSRKIQHSREKVMNLGYFQDVKVNTEPGDTPAEQVLVFEVEERHTGTISLGAGYSSVDYLTGYLQLTQNNLFGNGQTVSLQWELGTLRQSWQMSFTEPWLFDSPVSFGVDVWNITKRNGYSGQNYDLLSQGGSLRLGRRFDDFTKGYLTYKLQSDEYNNLDPSVLAGGIYKPGRSDISSLTPSMVFDTRDNVFDPSTGMTARLTVEMAGGLLGGDNNYFRYTTDESLFIPLVWKLVLALHGSVGYAYGYDYGVTGYTAVPPDSRFRVGGTDTIRGYSEGVFGSNYPGGGGLFDIVTNVELHYPIVGPLKGVAFFDAGNAWPDLSTYARYPSLYKGVGWGIRMTIPGTVILIRFDFGYPLDRDPTGKPQGLNYHFNIGNIF